MTETYTIECKNRLESCFVKSVQDFIHGSDSDGCADVMLKALDEILVAYCSEEMIGRIRCRQDANLLELFKHVRAASDALKVIEYMRGI